MATFFLKKVHPTSAFSKSSACHGDRFEVCLLGYPPTPPREPGGRPTHPPTPKVSVNQAPPPPLQTLTRLQTTRRHTMAGGGPRDIYYRNLRAANSGNRSTSEVNVSVAFAMLYAATRTLPLWCLVPIPKHTQADDTLMAVRGRANSRITPGSHTQQFGGARQFFVKVSLFLLSTWLHHLHPPCLSWLAIILPQGRASLPCTCDLSWVPVILPAARVGFPCTTRNDTCMPKW